MRKLKTSLKPTVKTTNVLDVKMENLLSKNPVVTVLYTRNDNRYLVCKSASTFKLGFPVIKPIIVNFAVQTGKSTSKDIANQVIDTMRKEFGLDPEILNYYEGTKRPYIYQNEYLKGNDIAFDTRDAGQYVGKPEIVKNPSGEYTDERWLTLNEINDLMNQGLFDENSSYYATRCSEAKRKRAVLDPRLSLHVYADKDGVHFNNNSKDQMPLKTLNGNGLQKLEETEDYCIYICKDAIMTTVEKYAPGAYQKFQETQALINSNEGLLKEYSIDWVNKDDADLFIQINNDEVAKIESQPIMLPIEGEEPTQPIVLEPKTVPTTYDCCFTVRKDDNYSLYINDGYENLASQGYKTNGVRITHIEKYSKVLLTNTAKLDTLYYYPVISPNFVVNTKYYCDFKVIDRESNFRCAVSYNGSTFLDRADNSHGVLEFNTSESDNLSGAYGFGFYMQPQLEIGSEYTIRIQITKTNTPKPFVKTIQPNCKLAFNTPATSETHSFIMKNCSLSKVYISSGGNLATKRYPIIQGIAGAGNFGDYFEFSYQTNSPAYENKIDFLLSKNYIKDSLNSTGQIGVNGQSKGRLNLTYQLGGYTSNSGVGYLSQLLLYKGNLTEAELKAELAKLDDQGFSYKKTENTYSISTRMWIDQYGLKKYDNPRDPFPFKTINNSGIKIMEETEDYQIWIDKDAVMTTVAKYAPGSYQTFLERKADIDGSAELLSLHEIEWTAQDDAKLFEDINNDALVKLEQSAMMLPVDEENEVQPIILEQKTVPTTYECCFRVDKKEKNFYIGEGYENDPRALSVSSGFFLERSRLSLVPGTLNTYKIDYYEPEGYINGYGYGFASDSKNGHLYTEVRLIGTSVPGKKIAGWYKFRDDSDSWLTQNNIHNDIDNGIYSLDFNRFGSPGSDYFRPFQLRNKKDGDTTAWSATIDIYVVPYRKPIVKSVMPSGKLAFVTNATSSTHSFVFKNINFTKDGYGGSYRVYNNDSNWSAKGEAIAINKTLFVENSNCLISNSYLTKDFEYVSKGDNSRDYLNIVGGAYSQAVYKTFTQLIIYKGNLTEAELKVENEKYN
ncbi:MAG: hypothetical protein ACRCX8_21010 [Sarcina sp.]